MSWVLIPCLFPLAGIPSSEVNGCVCRRKNLEVVSVWFHCVNTGTPNLGNNAHDGHQWLWLDHSSLSLRRLGSTCTRVYSKGSCLFFRSNQFIVFLCLPFLFCVQVYWNLTSRGSMANPSSVEMGSMIDDRSSAYSQSLWSTSECQVFWRLAYAAGADTDRPALPIDEVPHPTFKHRWLCWMSIGYFEFNSKDKEWTFPCRFAAAVVWFKGLVWVHQTLRHGTLGAYHPCLKVRVGEFLMRRMMRTVLPLTMLVMISQPWLHWISRLLLPRGAVWFWRLATSPGANVILDSQVAHESEDVLTRKRSTHHTGVLWLSTYWLICWHGWCVWAQINNDMFCSLLCMGLVWSWILAQGFRQVMPPWW